MSHFLSHSCPHDGASHDGSSYIKPQHGALEHVASYHPYSFPYLPHALARGSSAKGVHLAGNSPPSNKNRKVHKMCARYCEIPDMKLR